MLHDALLFTIVVFIGGLVFMLSFLFYIIYRVFIENDSK